SVSGKGTPGHTVEVTLPDGTKVTGEVDGDGNYHVDIPEGKTLEPGDKISVVEKDKDGHTSPAAETTVGDYPNTAKQPTVNPVTVDDKVITGKGTPGHTVEVTLPDGTKVTGKVDGDGNYRVDIPEGKTLKPGDKISVVEKDDKGHTSPAAETTVGDYPNTAKQPTVNPVTVDDKVITGKGTPGNTVEVTLPDGTKVTGKVDDDGNYRVDVPEGTTLKPGDKVSVVEKDKYDHASPATEVTVNDTENTAKQPTVDPVKGGDPSVSGKGTPGHTVEVTLPDGTKVTGKVDGDGNYHVDIPEGKTLKPGDKISVVEKDDKGHTSPAAETTVGDYPNTAKQPTVNPVTVDDKVITGKGTPGHTVEVTLPDGTKVTGKVDDDGNYRVDVPEGTTLKPGDKVSVVEKDKYDHASPATEVTVNDTENTAKQPTVDPVTVGDQVITGKGTPGHTVEVTLPDGTKATDKVEDNGNYRIDLPEGTVLEPGDKVSVVEKDKYDHVSPATEVTVNDIENKAQQPQVDPIKGGDTSISGKGTPGNKIEVTLPDGRTVTGRADKDGNYSIDVPEGVTLKPGDKVSVVEKDKDGHTSPATEVIVGEYPNTAQQPQVDPIKGGDTSVNGKGTPGHTVEVTLPDGTKVTGKVDDSGKFHIDLPAGTKLNPGDKVSVVEKDEHGHTSPATEVIVGDYPNTAQQPTVNPVTAGDKAITGKGTPGNTVEVTLPDGTKVTGKVDDSGKFHIDLPAGTKLNPGDKVSVVEKDQYGHASTPVDVTVKDSDNTAHQPQVDPIYTGDTTVSGHGTPGNTIKVTTPCGQTVTTKVGKDGRWVVELPKDVHLKAGDKVTVVEVDPNGHESTATVVTVTDKDMSGNNCDTPATGKDKGNAQTPSDNSSQAQEPTNEAPASEVTSNDQVGMTATSNSNGDQAEVAAKAQSEAPTSSDNKAKALPDTGNTENSGTIFGSLFAALGALFLVGRRRKEKEDK
ncbi:Ig-like domain-containing protein, partial [Staphylococcus sp. SQ8-PEA]